MPEDNCVVISVSSWLFSPTQDVLDGDGRRRGLVEANVNDLGNVLEWDRPVFAGQHQK